MKEKELGIALRSLAWRLGDNQEDGLNYIEQVGRRDEFSLDMLILSTYDVTRWNSLVGSWIFWILDT